MQKAARVKRKARRWSGCDHGAVPQRRTPVEEKRNTLMTKFADLGLSKDALAAVEKPGLREAHACPGAGYPAGSGRPRPHRRRLHRHRQDGRVPAAHLEHASPRERAATAPPRVLVVSPTRELAQQIARTCMQISRQTRHFTTTVFGGTPYGPQIKELRGGTDVLIATPGRLKDLMKRGVVEPVQRGGARAGRGRPHAGHGLSARRDHHRGRHARRAARRFCSRPPSTSPSRRTWARF